MHRFFAAGYAQARERFLHAAGQAGAALQAIEHPLRGREGEVLALDVARLGPRDARRLVIVSSGCHGIEGVVGGAAQLALLQSPGPLTQALHDDGVQLVLLHALNPWGWSHGRRNDHENIDLNRNFVDFTTGVPANPGYDELAAMLVPGAWPPPADSEARLFGLLAQRGQRVLQQAVSAGQYGHPGGLFYGGRAPSWSRLALQAVVPPLLQQADEVRWLDLHSGLGTRGVGERIHGGPATAEAADRARAVWGALTSTHDGSSVSADVGGEMLPAFANAQPALRFAGLTLEFGTQPLLQVVQALRAEAWLRQHGDAGATLQKAVDAALREAFAPDDEGWQDGVLKQALEALQQALQAPWDA